MSDFGTEAMAYLTAMTTGWNEDVVLAYAAELDRLADNDALRDAVQGIARTWDKSHRPALAVVLEAYHHELAKRAADQRNTLGQRGVIRCDGRSWVTMPGGETVPCPSCAPMLHKLWHTPSLMHRWRNGDAAWRLMDCADIDAYKREFSRVNCPPPAEDRAVYPTSVQGRKIAATAYMDARDVNRKPGPMGAALLAHVGQHGRAEPVYDDASDF
jgi:hypothetical protein